MKPFEFRSRFFWKLFASYISLVLLSLAVVGILVEKNITRNTLNETRRSLEARAVLVREIALRSLRGENDPTLQDRVTELGRSIDTRLTVIQSDGTVIADSDDDPAQMDDHRGRPEILAALKDGFGSSTRFSSTVGATMMYFALAVRDGDRNIGYVRTSLALTAVRERLAEITTVVAVGAVVAAVFSLLVGFFVARRVTSPLIRMTASAESIAGGDFGNRVAPSTGDEIGTLGIAFNRMADALDKTMNTITRDRNTLLTILRGMGEGLLAVDADEKIVHLNSAAGKIFDVEPEESIGHSVWKVTRVHEVKELLGRSMNTQARIRGTVLLPVVGGTKRELEVHVAPLTNSDGGHEGAVAVFDDVTELRKLETVRQDFVTNVSHELKTPIAAILGLVETVLGDSSMDEAIRTGFLSRIQIQSRRLASLVSDLLTLARLDFQESVFEAEPVNIVERARSSVEQLQPVAEKSDVSLSFVATDEALMVLGDPESLNIVFNNLIDNAIKYTNPKGMVLVDVGRDGRFVVVRVTDTGIGISQEHWNRVFERFYRVDKARSRERGGTGLGLSIVKHVVKIHQGTVHLTSEVGKGCTFSVRLPLD